MISAFIKVQRYIGLFLSYMKFPVCWQPVFEYFLESISHESARLLPVRGEENHGKEMGDSGDLKDGCVEEDFLARPIP